jgi:hypothetical protein
MSDAQHTNRHRHIQHGDVINILFPLTEGKYVQNDSSLVSVARDDGGKSKQLVWNKTRHGPTRSGGSNTRVAHSN